MTYLLNDPKLEPEEVNSLYSSVGWNGKGQRTLEKTRRTLAASPYVVTARVEEQLVGFGRILGDAYTAQILDVMVHPECRRRGVASGVLERLLDAAKGKFLGVYLIDGSGYKKFYERFGFETANPHTDRLMYWTGQNG